MFDGLKTYKVQVLPPHQLHGECVEGLWNQLTWMAFDRPTTRTLLRWNWRRRVIPDGSFVVSWGSGFPGTLCMPPRYFIPFGRWWDGGLCGGG